MTCTVQGLKRSTQYKFRVSGGANEREGSLLSKCVRDSGGFFCPSILGLLKDWPLITDRNEPSMESVVTDAQFGPLLLLGVSLIICNHCLNVMQPFLWQQPIIFNTSSIWKMNRALYRQRIRL